MIGGLEDVQRRSKGGSSSGKPPSAALAKGQDRRVHNGWPWLGRLVSSIRRELRSPDVV